jgi:hypothetical protein
MKKKTLNFFNRGLMEQIINELLKFIFSYNGINDKAKLIALVVKRFALVKDRSVYYNDTFAIRFSQVTGNGFSNTILSLSALQKYDTRPFFVCGICPTFNFMLISNTTFLKKISHSSQELSMNNIKGSFNGSDIVRIFNAIDNTPENFYRLFLIHQSIGFEGNLQRLVDETSAIVGTGHTFNITETAKTNIFNSPRRAIEFTISMDYKILKKELDEKVIENKHYILLASLIENVNVRGRVIEYLIAGEDIAVKEELISALVEKQRGLPRFTTDDSLGDYSKEFESFYTETDIKTKIMILDSNPKAYIIDKMLEFLSKPKSVFLFYFIGINPCELYNTVLTSMFESRLVAGTLLLKHWAGRNSRGVTQLEGKYISSILTNPGNIIDINQAIDLLNKMINA